MEITADIKGYRQLSEREQALINEVKEHADSTGALISKLRADTSLDAGLDGRWVAIATTELQQGYMALIRAIAQPTSF